VRAVVLAGGVSRRDRMDYPAAGRDPDAYPYRCTIGLCSVTRLVPEVPSTVLTGSARSEFGSGDCNDRSWTLTHVFLFPGI
jgi:hypothetical protein